MLKRADGGEDIFTKHENINMNYNLIGKAKMPHESDHDRMNRTGLSSLRITDDESKAVQKTPNRVSLDSMEKKIKHTEFLHPGLMPHMTICFMLLENGFALIGKSTPADPENFDEKLGMKFAYEDALRQMWPLEAYLLREKMFTESAGASAGG